MISRKDAVLIASRVVAVYCFAWSIDNATYLPTELVNLSRHIADGSVLIGSSFWLKYYWTTLLLTVLRIVLFTGAGWFFTNATMVFRPSFCLCKMLNRRSHRRNLDHSQKAWPTALVVLYSYALPLELAYLGMIPIPTSIPSVRT